MRIGLRPVVLMAMAVLVGTPLMGGCSMFGNGSHDSSAALITSPNPPIADVPVPAGFALIRKVSTSKVIPASNVRFVDHQYSGPDDYLPVVAFYKDQMPATGWKLVDQTQNGGGVIALRFTKGLEDCGVTVSAGSLTSHTHIRIQINPTGKAAGG